MKTNVQGYRVIKSPADVAQFFIYLVFERKVNIHPDDPFKDYVNENLEPTFTTEEAECYDRMMETSFDICETYGVDIYEICCRVFALYYYCCNNSKMTGLYDGK